MSEMVGLVGRVKLHRNLRFNIAQQFLSRFCPKSSRDLTEAVLKVKKKEVIIIPKRFREAAGIREDSEVTVNVLQRGLLLRSLADDPVRTLENLPTMHEASSVASIRSLRRKKYSEPWM